MTDMDINISSTFLPATDPDASLAFYRDALGFEIRNDVGRGTMRWITVGPAGQKDVSIVLSSPNVDAAFAKVEATGADVVQEPIDQPYGIRDCAFRDPAGNTVRINQQP